MKKLNVILISMILLTTIACKNNKSEDQTNQEKESKQNLLYSAENWKSATDALGSSYSPEKIVVENDVIEVDFTLKKKEEGEIVFIELVCELGKNLKEYKGLEIEYACDSSLAVKLSQSDFGESGNETYSHFQFVVPKSDSFSVAKLNFSEFTQPTWTPEESKSIPLKLENVLHIYLTPTVNSAYGGSSNLKVKGLYLIK